MLGQGWDVGIEAAEQETAVALEPGHLGQVVGAVLVELVRVAGTRRVLDLQQLAGIVESPAVERAGISRLVGPLVAAQHGAAMAAGVDEGVQFVVLVAGDEDRLPAHIGRVVVVLVGDLAFMGEIDPVAFEDVLHLQLEPLRVGENVAPGTVEAVLLILDDGGLEPFHEMRIHGVSSLLCSWPSYWRTRPRGLSALDEMTAQYCDAGT